MSTVLDVPRQEAVTTDRDAFNVAVWDRLSEDAELAKLDYRIETDEHGQIIVSPPPAPSHGNYQSEVAFLLRSQLPEGKTLTECPISTGKGVKAADVAWCSIKIWEETVGKSCFLSAPEICVEVISPSNTQSEIREKKTLYFEKGAQEVWFVRDGGRVSFYASDDPSESVAGSIICPDFPSLI